jgi:hypothetical protein
MFLLVRAYWPSCSPLSPGSPDVLAEVYSLSETLSERAGVVVKDRWENLWYATIGCAGLKEARGALAARAACLMIWDLNIFVVFVVFVV